jgi:hypothetical protein
MANNEIGGINALALNNNRPRLSLFWPGLGTDSDNNKTKVSGPKDKEPASANEPAVRRRKRRKEELIRLDDLIPKKNVKVVVKYPLVSLTQQTTEITGRIHKMAQKKQSRRIKVRDRKPKRDATLATVAGRSSRSRRRVRADQINNRIMVRTLPVWLQ